eukprot:550123_1
MNILMNFFTISGELETFMNFTIYDVDGIITPLIDNDCSLSRIDVLPNCDESLLFRSTAVMWGDIGNMGKSYANYLPWVWKVQEEFFRLGDFQKTNNILLGVYNDRYNPDIANGQVGWAQFAVLPFTQLLASFMPELNFVVDNVAENIAAWSTEPTYYDANKLEDGSGSVSFVDINGNLNKIINDFEIELLISLQYGQLQDSLWIGDESGYLVFLDVSRSRLYKYENDKVSQISEIAGRPYSITTDDAYNNGYVALQDSQGIATINIENGTIMDDIYKYNGNSFGGPYSIHYFDNNVYFSDMALAAVNPQNGINGIWSTSSSDLSQTVSLLISSDFGYSGITNDEYGNVFTLNLLAVNNTEFSPYNPGLQWDFNNMQYQHTDTSLNDAINFDIDN